MDKKIKTEHITLYNNDNKVVLEELIKENKKFKIVYLDPPYNTGNVFSYIDRKEQEEWRKDFKERLLLSRELLLEDGCVIISISEESLSVVLSLTTEIFNFVYPPFVWLTKNELNQNKVNSVNSVIHEYVIVASNNKIESNLEEVKELELIEEKYKNYPLNIHLLEKPKMISFNGKNYLEFTKFKLSKEEFKNKELIEFLKENYNLNLTQQIFQKRTKQKGHGSERYYNELIKLPNFNQNHLYCLLDVKDKNNLNGKFLLNTSYFQSIQKNQIKIKIPSFLGFYQAGMKNFQTAKPIELIKRLLLAFSNEKDEILDLYSGSGNVLKAILKTKRKATGIEFDKKTFNEILLKNLNLKLD